MADVKATTLITRAQARSWVLNDSADASKDDDIVLLADAASARLERDTSRVFKARTVTDRAIGDGVGTVLYLMRYPVTAIASFTSNGVAVDSTRYYLDGPRGRIVLTTGFVLPNGADLAVTYTAGYADADLPDDAVEIGLQLLKRGYQLKTKGGQSFQTVTLGGQSFMMRDTLPADLIKAIEKIRDKRFG